MNKVAFSVGGFEIHWYGILVAVGFLTGLWTASRRAPRRGIAAEAVADFGPWAIVGALLGARLLYVVTYWREDFADRPLWEIFNLRSAGLVFYGGLAGATLATLMYVRRHRLPLWQFADVLAPSIPLGQAFGRIGCLFSGCCYGTSTNLPWALHYHDNPQLRGVGVHPTQVYEALLNLALYAGLAWYYRRKPLAGETFSFYLLGYAVIRFGVEFLRGDYGDKNLLGMKPGQAVSLLVFAAGLALMNYRRRPSPRTEG